MKKKPQNEDSDEFDADEPEEQGSGSDDWAPEDEPAKKKRGRPAAKAASKKATPAKKKKVEKKPPSDEEDEEEEEEEEEEEDEEGEESEDESDAAGNGSFVVLKSDLKDGTEPPLWKIDGKALLQKFIPFEQDGKKLHKSTSTYSGWTQNNRDQYAAAPVSYVVQGKKETIIEFLRSQVNLDEKKEVLEEATKKKAKA